MAKIVFLECSKCGHQLSAETPQMLCTKCQGSLYVRYDLKALLIGSHSDTQPKGGWLDGALGVIYGIEIVRAFAEDPATRALPVDAVAWVDEESTYLGCLGSRSFCGVLTQDTIAAATNAEGHRLSEAIKAAADTSANANSVPMFVRL